MVVVESHSQNEGKDRSDEHRVIGETERRDQQTAADLHHSRKESSKQTTEQLLWKQRDVRDHRRRHHEKGNNAQAEEDGLVSDDSGTETETLALLPVMNIRMTFRVQNATSHTSIDSHIGMSWRE